MNTTKGQSAVKQHLRSGSKTSCNRKTSGIGNNEVNDFKWWFEKYPEQCCIICLNRFIEKAKHA
jgi:hypothetical protein